MSDWLVVPKIETPDIWDDVKKYCGIMLSREKYDALSLANKEKLLLLTERLEFIDHLLVLREGILKKTSYELKFEEIPEDVEEIPEDVEVNNRYRCLLWGHDFAGAHYDIDAMVFYLLLTCIDTIKGQADYKDAFDWLACPEKVKLIENQDEDALRINLIKLKEEYKNDFGLHRRFLDAFMRDLSKDLQGRLVDSLIVVEVESGKIKPNSMVNWKKRDFEAKLKKIAAKLYSIRSSFTHNSLRTFLPSYPLERVPRITGEQLLCKKGVSLLHLLNEVVKCLINSQVIV